MPSLLDLSKIPFKDRYPEDYPPYEFYMHEKEITENVVNGLKELIERCAAEKEIDKYITNNPVLLTSILDFNNTGHHAAWVIPKKVIRQNISNNIPGLIPDFLVGGKNSFGITWHVVELKGANETLFINSGKKLYLSGIANRGLCQVLEYMHFCNKAQSNLRENLKLKNFISANGFLIIGRSTETDDERKKDLKASLNIMNSNLQIRSYDALINCCNRILGIN